MIDFEQNLDRYVNYVKEIIIKNSKMWRVNLRLKIREKEFIFTYHKKRDERRNKIVPFKGT